MDQHAAASPLPEVPEHVLLECATALCASPEGFNTPGEEHELAAMPSFREVIGIAFRAGTEAALNREEWHVARWANTHLPSAYWYREPMAASDCEAQAREDFVALMHEGIWGECFIERRKVGATDWERVAP